MIINIWYPTFGPVSLFFLFQGYKYHNLKHQERERERARHQKKNDGTGS